MKVSTLVGGILKRLRGTKVIDLPLEFHMDTREDGRHKVQVSYTLEGETTWIEDVSRLWRYGEYRIQRDGVEYVVSHEDLDTLLALQSLQADIGPSGELIFDICPPVLRHLRRKRAIRESKASLEYVVLDDPLQVGAKIDYDPENGLLIEAGYQLPESTKRGEHGQQGEAQGSRPPGESGLVPQRGVKVTPDGRYGQLGKCFAPLPTRLSTAVQSWLRRVRRRVRPDHIPEFFKRDLVLLKTEMGAVLTDEASRLKVVKLPAAPRVRVQTSSEPGWLDFQVDYEVEGHAISLEAVRGAEGKNLRPDPYLYVEVPVGESNRVVRGLEELQPVETSEGYRIPISRFASLEGFIEELGGQSEVDAAYQQFLEELEGFQADKAFRLSDAIEQDLLRANIRLYDHQRAGIHWLTWLSDHHLHGLLADDMGLGKTIQTATALRWAWEQSAPERHSLIVCPKSVIRHWHRELKRCFPGLDVYEYIGTGRNRNIWNRSTPTVMISTYSTVARDVETIAEVPLFFLVLDESTKIKNPETQRSQAVKALNAAHRIALSGTPVENRPAELWSVFDYLMRGHLGRYGTFQRMFEAPIMEGDAAAAGRLGKRIGPFLLRRRKEEVAEDLPDKVEMEEWVELTAEQRRLYKSIQGQEAREVRRSLQRGKQVSRTHIFAILTRLKQVCDHPALITDTVEPLEGRSEKFDLVLERVEEILAAGEKVIVFSQFLNTLSLLQAALQARRVKHVRLDGSLSLSARQGRIDRLNEGDAQVALCSLQAVGHGVNLIGANHVIHIDRWWNPAIEDQATDRAHRIGQAKTVFVHLIQTRNTLEEKIAMLQERKRGLSDDIMSAAAQQGLQWTREELLEILQPLD